MGTATAAQANPPDGPPGRRVRRAIGMGVTVGSAAVAVLTAGVTLRSFVRADYLAWNRYTRTDPPRDDGTIPQDHFRMVTAVVSRGAVNVNWWDLSEDAGYTALDEDHPSGHTGGPPVNLMRTDRTWAGRLGFAWSGHPTRDAAVPFQCGCPIVPIPVVAAVPPAVAVRRWQRRRRASRAGWCPGCGYDLRASPTACPECGRVGQRRPSR